MKRCDKDNDGGCLPVMIYDSGCAALCRVHVLYVVSVVEQVDITLRRFRPKLEALFDSYSGRFAVYGMVRRTH